MSLVVPSLTVPGVETKVKRKYVKKSLLAPLVGPSESKATKPKRNPSAYNLFVQTHLKSPELAGINQKDKMKKVAEMWRQQKSSASEGGP